MTKMDKHRLIYVFLFFAGLLMIFAAQVGDDDPAMSRPINVSAMINMAIRMTPTRLTASYWFRADGSLIVKVWTGHVASAPDSFIVEPIYCYETAPKLPD